MTQIYIKQSIHKHRTQNFWRISPFGITPVEKAHKARWATVDWSWLKEWNWFARADLHFKKKKKAQADIDSSNNLPPKSSFARKRHHTVTHTHSHTHTQSHTHTHTHTELLWAKILHQWCFYSSGSTAKFDRLWLPNFRSNRYYQNQERENGLGLFLLVVAFTVT